MGRAVSRLHALGSIAYSLYSIIMGSRVSDLKTSSLLSCILQDDVRAIQWIHRFLKWMLCLDKWFGSCMLFCVPQSCFSCDYATSCRTSLGVLPSGNTFSLHSKMGFLRVPWVVTLWDSQFSIYSKEHLLWVLSEKTSKQLTLILQIGGDNYQPEHHRLRGDAGLSDSIIFPLFVSGKLIQILR